MYTLFEVVGRMTNDPARVVGLKDRRKLGVGMGVNLKGQWEVKRTERRAHRCPRGRGDTPRRLSRRTETHDGDSMHRHRCAQHGDLQCIAGLMTETKGRGSYCLTAFRRVVWGRQGLYGFLTQEPFGPSYDRIIGDWS